jgi:hypothetical protein
MINQNNNIWSNIRVWHSLTEIPKHPVTPSVKTVNDTKITAVDTTSAQETLHPILSGASEAVHKLLWDIVCYPYTSLSVRFKRTGISVREGENAVSEGCEKRFFFRSSAGSTVYLIPENKVFVAFKMDDLFDSGDINRLFYLLLQNFE